MDVTEQVGKNLVTREGILSHDEGVEVDKPDSPITKVEVRSAIKKMKVGKAIGPRRQTTYQRRHRSAWE